MAKFEVSDIDYEEYSNRQLAAIPLAILAVALLVVLAWYVLFGTPVDLGLAFTGGTEVQFTADDSLSEVRSTFGDVDYDSVQPSATGNTYILTTQANASEIGSIERAAGNAGYNIEQVQSRSASFGASAQQQALLGIVAAFAGMGVLVFILFRTFIPSIAVILSAFSDIMIPVAMMNLLGIKLSLGTVAALLMLIGYSVDSDLLLNNHILRRRGGFYESTFRAMRTGITMTLTSIAGMTMMTIVSTVVGIPLLPDIGLILVFGLTVDLMNTYMLNLSLLRYYKFEGVSS
jgi:preprotein translocase subunit SecF